MTYYDKNNYTFIPYALRDKSCNAFKVDIEKVRPYLAEAYLQDIANERREIKSVVMDEGDLSWLLTYFNKFLGNGSTLLERINDMMRSIEVVKLDNSAGICHVATETICNLNGFFPIGDRLSIGLVEMEISGSVPVDFFNVIKTTCFNKLFLTEQKNFIDSYVFAFIYSEIILNAKDSIFTLFSRQGLDISLLSLKFYISDEPIFRILSNSSYYISQKNAFTVQQYYDRCGCNEYVVSFDGITNINFTCRDASINCSSNPPSTGSRPVPSSFHPNGIIAGILNEPSVSIGQKKYLEENHLSFDAFWAQSKARKDIIISKANLINRNLNFIISMGIEQIIQLVENIRVEIKKLIASNKISNPDDLIKFVEKSIKDSEQNPLVHLDAFIDFINTSKKIGYSASTQTSSSNIAYNEIPRPAEEMPLDTFYRTLLIIHDNLTKINVDKATSYISYMANRIDFYNKKFSIGNPIGAELEKMFTPFELFDDKHISNFIICATNAISSEVESNEKIQAFFSSLTEARQAIEEKLDSTTYLSSSDPSSIEYSYSGYIKSILKQSLDETLSYYFSSIYNENDDIILVPPEDLLKNMTDNVEKLALNHYLFLVEHPELQIAEANKDDNDAANELFNSAMEKKKKLKEKLLKVKSSISKKGSSVKSTIGKGKSTALNKLGGKKAVTEEKSDEDDFLG